MLEGEGLDELEYKNLQGAIACVEAELAFVESERRPLLENCLHNSRARLQELKEKIEEAKHEKESQEKQQLAIAQLAEKEAALSQSEKETYSGFLAKEFFTKHDFKQLEQFYSQSWDRLSEGGKEEMSHRVWEGVRHDEYRFGDLPKVVQEKEAQRVYGKLTAPSVNQASLAQIPETDRIAFVEAYQSGDRKTAYQVLDRDSFKRNMSLETSTGIKHEAADTGKKVDDQATVSNVKSGLQKSQQPVNSPREPVPIADINLDAVNLKDVKLADASPTPSVASMPDASGPRVNVR